LLNRYWTKYIISDIVNKKERSKFEHYMGSFTYYDKRVFQTLGISEYEDNDIAMKLNLMKLPLYDITNTEDIQNKIIVPVLEMYRKKQ